ncbi:MAG: hypothetical protein H6553_10860 [Chitinophagales bacterium]|nr:hypothetical protein [Chitinophagales bacterium]
MKKATNIVSLIIAFVFLFNANGVIVFKHLCKTENIANYSVLNSPGCEKEKESKEESCCKEQASKSNDCCEHSLSFKKFSYNGFTSNLFELKKVDIVPIFNFPIVQSIVLIKQCRVQFQGLSPPYPDYHIEQYLQPSLEALQSFLC